MVAQDEGEGSKERAIEEVPVQEVSHLMGCGGEVHRSNSRHMTLRERQQLTDGEVGLLSGGHQQLCQSLSDL